jgi:hypothetical protein
MSCRFVFTATGEIYHCMTDLRLHRVHPSITNIRRVFCGFLLEVARVFLHALLLLHHREDAYFRATSVFSEETMAGFLPRPAFSAPGGALFCSVVSVTVSSESLLRFNDEFSRTGVLISVVTTFSVCSLSVLQRLTGMRRSIKSNLTNPLRRLECLKHIQGRPQRAATPGWR